MFGALIMGVMSYAVVDKETKMRETLKIMGLSREAYAASWMVLQGVFVLYTATFFMIGIAIAFSHMHDGTYVHFIPNSIG